MAAGYVETYTHASPLPRYLKGPGGATYVRNDEVWWRTRRSAWLGMAQGALLAVMLIFFPQWALMFATLALGVALMARLLRHNFGRRRRWEGDWADAPRRDVRVRRRVSADEGFASFGAERESVGRPGSDMRALEDFDRRLEEAVRQTAPTKVTVGA